MKDCSMSELLAYALFSTLLLTAPATATAGLTMRADLTHVDSGRGFTRWELLSRMAVRSRARAASLYRRGTGGRYGQPVMVTAAPASGEYLIHFNIGTPRPQRVALTMDTGSDLIWTQCTPCPVCFHQSFPLFDPSVSSTFRAVACPDPICRRPGSGLRVSACAMKSSQCFYLCAYGDKSVTAGYIFKDTFTFKSPNGGKGGVPVAVSELAFGCGEYNTGEFSSDVSGIAGFGRGPLSLPSQLKVGRFSYCLTSHGESKTSAVFLGTPPPDDLRAHSTGPFQSTPIIYNPETPTFYYLSFEGITVGKTRLPVDKSVFALKKDGSGGAVIDSGTGLTTLPDAVFELLQAEFVAQFPPLPRYNNTSEVGDMLCFRRPKGGEQVPVPKLIFHLAGADMDLPRENYILEDTDAGLMCVSINPAKGGDMVLIGNFQQQNMHIVYDVENNKLLFASAQCDRM